MQILLLVIAVVSFCIGISYIYFQNVILKFCELIKKYLFNEKIIILYGKKVGFLFILIGTISVIVLVRIYYISTNIYYLAYKKFYQGEFKAAEKLCEQILLTQPQNIEVLYLLGKIYIATKQYESAKKVFTKIKNLSSQKEEEKANIYLEIIKKNEN